MLPNLTKTLHGKAKLKNKQVAKIWGLQGPPTHIDTFQTNIFSWFNDTVIQSQWFLGLWDREIWYKTLFFHFINLTWPPWPQKEKV